MEEFMKLSRIAAALGLACTAVFAAPVSAQQITLMTGPQGGVWVPLGGQLKSMWEKAIPGQRARCGRRQGASRLWQFQHDRGRR
jgi:TRAP-type uncharacterized transport system substrate-binding protein